jgi:hypothetical protein
MIPIALPLMLNRRQPRPQFPNQGYLPNGTASAPAPGAQALLPNNGRIIQSGPIRVLCIADVRGKFVATGQKIAALMNDLQETSNL